MKLREYLNLLLQNQIQNDHICNGCLGVCYEQEIEE
jgi:hypothetical protein